jgi:UDP-glucose 4-epimerase
MSGPLALVIGSGSYLAREFIARCSDLPLRAIAHGEADQAAHYEGVSAVVNFAFAPALHYAAYDAAADIDRLVARHAAARGLHYVMMSSRRVYQEAVQWNASEEADAAGHDAYGRNKLAIELHLRDIIGDRLTILRPGNVIGYEPQPGRQRFGAFLQNQLLRTGAIRLTVSPQARRDLVPVAFFCRVLKEALLRRVGGAFNVGSGAATRVGDAARWLIEGFGTGDVLAGSEAVTDEFLLDSSKLQRVFGLACAAGEVRRTLIDAGRRLSKETARRASD